MGQARSAKHNGSYREREEFPSQAKALSVERIPISQSRCRYLVSREGKYSVVIFSDLRLSAFSEYMHSKQAINITLNMNAYSAGVVFHGGLIITTASAKQLWQGLMLRGFE